VDRRPPDRSLDASSTLDFGKKDGRAARGTGIRLSPTFCEQKHVCTGVCAGAAISHESREKIILMEMTERGVSPSCKINCYLITRNGAVIVLSFFQRSEGSSRHTSRRSPLPLAHFQITVAFLDERNRSSLSNKFNLILIRDMCFESGFISIAHKRRSISYNSPYVIYIPAMESENDQLLNLSFCTAYRYVLQVQ